MSEEGVTQGGPLAMILYGVTLVVPLAEALQAAVPSVLKIWYPNNAAMAGKAKDIATCMRLLMWLGLARGYFAEPSKPICIGRPEHETKAKEILEEFLSSNTLTGLGILEASLGASKPNTSEYSQSFQSGSETLNCSGE